MKLSQKLPEAVPQSIKISPQAPHTYLRFQHPRRFLGRVVVHLDVTGDRLIGDILPRHLTRHWRTKHSLRATFTFTEPLSPSPLQSPVCALLGCTVTVWCPPRTYLSSIKLYPEPSQQVNCCYVTARIKTCNAEFVPVE